MAKVTFSAKSSDLNSYSVFDDDGERVHQGYGYVPDLGFGSGDYVEFTVDLATGQIEGWRPLTADQAVAAIKGEDEEEDESGED